MKDIDAATPTMGAETGYAVDEQPPPIRPSGFLALLFGLGSCLCLLGRPLLFMPLIAIGLAFFALRACKQGTPVGTLAARVGMLLGVGFGCVGFFVPWFTQQSVGKEASYFAKQYIHLIVQDDDALAFELGQDHVNRVSTKMSLQVNYDNIKNGGERGEGQMNEVIEYEGDDVVKTIKRLGGGDIDLELKKAPRVYTFYGENRVDTVWNTPQDTLRFDLVITMAYLTDQESGRREWYMKQAQWYKDQAVAEGNY